MSTSLLLPCSPSPHRTPGTDRSAPLGRAPPLLSLGGLSSYTTCQGPNKTPLLKGRRSSQVVVLPLSPSENSLPHSPSGARVNPRKVSLPSGVHFAELSPPRRAFLPAEPLPRREASPPSRLYSGPDPFTYREIYHHRKPFLSKVPPKTFSESSSSLSPLSPNSPPQSPNIPTFPHRLVSPTSPTSPTPRSQLKKSQSTLIMPSLLTLLRPEPVSAAPLQRDLSSRSLNDPTSPSPLIRKCHTMVTLSGSSNGSVQPTTKPVKDKKTRFGFLRRISPSKSAVFSSSKSSSSFQSSSLRKSPSAAHSLQHTESPRKYSVSMWPHPEHPEEMQRPENDDRLHREGDITLTEEDRLWSAGAGGCSRCTSSNSIPSRRHSSVTNDAVFCKLCLTDVSIREMYQLQQCQCRFCTYCMCMYTTLKIREGESVIECPDSNCDCRGDLTLDEVESLVGKELLNLHLKFRRDREIEADPFKTWCPKPGCETVVSLSVSKLDGRPQCCSCPTCITLFCASCASTWHPGKPCNRVVGQAGVPLNDAIKRCPRCKVPIERDAGCAQMQCKKCKHVFCWYCLASLEDDFLLRHYDKGPCKNKLGHSRASVLWHRAQVVVIFAGFGLLLVIASPLLLFVGPCLLCRSCRPCSSSSSSSSSSGSRPDSDEEGNAGI